MYIEKYLKLDYCSFLHNLKADNLDSLWCYVTSEINILPDSKRKVVVVAIVGWGGGRGLGREGGGEKGGEGGEVCTLQVLFSFWVRKYW